jgi:hypothetical protein
LDGSATQGEEKTDFPKEKTPPLHAPLALFHPERPLFNVVENPGDPTGYEISKALKEGRSVAEMNKRLTLEVATLNPMGGLKR